MTKKIYYEKVGRRYKPVYEYDPNLMDAYPKGNHLVVCRPGGTSRKFNIDAAYAPMIAAGMVAQDAITKSIMDAAKLRPARALITEEQRIAWQRLANSFGDELCTLQGSSAYDCAQAGVQAMIAEADKLLTNPAVRKAYERFLLTVALTKEEEKCTN